MLALPVWMWAYKPMTIIMVHIGGLYYFEGVLHKDIHSFFLILKTPSATVWYIFTKSINMHFSCCHPILSVMILVITGNNHKQKTCFNSEGSKITSWYHMGFWKGMNLQYVALKKQLCLSVKRQKQLIVYVYKCLFL